MPERVGLMENNSYGQAASPGDPNGFFGGAIAPATRPALEQRKSTRPRGQHPAVRGAIVFVVVTSVAAAAAAAAYFGIRELVTPKIELPETMMGMERLDPESDFMRGTDRALNETELAPLHIDFHVAGYGEAGHMVVVGAAERKGGLPVERFFALTADVHIDRDGADLEKVPTNDPSVDLRCMPLDIPQGYACAWLTEETVGTVFMVGEKLNPASVVADVRAAIER